jgi:hypothetical protein
MSPPGPAMNPSSDIAAEYEKPAMVVLTSHAFQSHHRAINSAANRKQFCILQPEVLPSY